MFQASWDAPSVPSCCVRNQVREAGLHAEAIADGKEHVGAEDAVGVVVHAGEEPAFAAVATVEPIEQQVLIAGLEVIRSPAVEISNFSSLKPKVPVKPISWQPPPMRLISLRIWLNCRDWNRSSVSTSHTTPKFKPSH